MKKKVLIDITPDRSIFDKLSNSGYAFEEAVAELIDNAIDAQDSCQELIVQIILRKASVKINDNANGMDYDTISNLMKLGYSSKHFNKLGFFGLGFKTSCLSIGKKIKVESVNHKKKNYKYSFLFDIDDFVKNGTWNKFPILEEVGNSEFNSGTNITISRLKIKINSKKIKELEAHIALRYSLFLKNKRVSIFVGDKLIGPTDIGIHSEEKIPISITLSNKHVITGWYGYRIGGNNRYGFNTFRRGRLITLYDKIGLSKEQKIKQIVGELHLDFVPVSHNKRNWIKESKEWIQSEKEISNIIFSKEKRLTKIVSGLPAYPGKVEGIARIVNLEETETLNAGKFKKGDILVTYMVRPIFLLQVKRASAIVTDQGGRLSHAAIL
ncbi:MAG TPA: hypothetical protein ENI76_04875, partial [Ignavibacteria bacterium]|nr:hypothetical protein [Ignavibacteria bacterium]